MGLHGKDATVIFASTVLEASEWAIDRVQETADITSFESGGDRDNLTGLRAWTGTFVSESNAEVFGLQSTASFRPSKVSAVSTTNPFYNGKVIITNEAIAVPVDDKVGWSYTFIGKGPLVKQTS